METIFNEQTSFLKLEEKVLPTLENASKINIDMHTFSREKYQNWYLFHERYFYFKTLPIFEILSYLLAEKIGTTYFSLPIAHFIPAKVLDSVGLASLNFRKEEKCYFYGSMDYFPFLDPVSAFSFLKNFFHKEESYYKLTNDLLRLIAYHIYIGLKDLISANLLFQKETDGFSLAPVYDLDKCFRTAPIDFTTTSFYYYVSVMCNFYLPSERLDMFNKYFSFQNALKIILDVDMGTSLSAIEKEYNVSIPEMYKEYYRNQDKMKKDLVRHLHL